MAAGINFVQPLTNGVLSCILITSKILDVR